MKNRRKKPRKPREAEFTFGYHLRGRLIGHVKLKKNGTVFEDHVYQGQWRLRNNEIEILRKHSSEYDYYFESPRFSHLNKVMYDAYQHWVETTLCGQLNVLIVH